MFHNSGTVLFIQNNKKSTDGDKMPFSKGKSGNPGGRPKLTEFEKKSREELKKIFLENSPKAAKTIVELLNNGDNSTKLKAATFILNKLYGEDSVICDNQDQDENNTLNLRIVSVSSTGKERTVKTNRYCGFDVIDDSEEWEE